MGCRGRVGVGEDSQESSGRERGEKEGGSRSEAAQHPPPPAYSVTGGSASLGAPPGPAVQEASLDSEYLGMRMYGLRL